MIYKMTLTDSTDSMTMDLLEVPIADNDVEGAVDNTTIDGNVFTDYLWLKKKYVQKWAIMCPDEYDRLRGFYTRQWTNASVPSYRLYYGDDIIRHFTDGGDFFQITTPKSMVSGSLDSFSLYGNASQTSYSGKNLLPSINTTRTMNGVTFTTNADGSITMNGTATANATYPINANSSSVTRNVTLESGTYTINGQNKDGVLLQAYYTVDGGSGLYSTGTFTFSGTATLGAYVRVMSGSTVTNYTIYPQVEAGSTATDWEQYVGGTASPNPDYPQDIQVVTGENVVKITGKNLFDQSTIAAGDIRGINATMRLCSTQSIYLPAGTYTASSNIPTTFQLSFSTNAVGAPFLSAYPAYLFNSSWQSMSSAFTFTTTQAGWFAVQVRKTDNSALTVSDILAYNIQLELGSTATDYEPYQGQEYEVNLGKNLWTLASSYANSSTSASWVLGDTTVSIPAGTYTFSCDSTSSSSNGFNYKYADGVSHSASFVNSTTVTFTEEVKKVALRLAGNTTISNIQLEKGSQATSYSEYFTPLELAKIGTYQDKIIKTDGTWYIHKEVRKVVLSSQTWVTRSWGFYGGNIADALPSPNNNSIAEIMASNFVAVTANNCYGLSGEFTHGIAISMDKSLLARATDITDLATFTAKMAGQSLYYALATPVDEEITNSALIEQLDSILSASLYKGTNNVMLTGTGAQGTIGVGYNIIYSKSTDVVELVPVRLNLTDDGVINTCGCRRNIQLTMRETTQ